MHELYSVMFPGFSRLVEHKKCWVGNICLQLTVVKFVVSCNVFAKLATFFFFCWQSYFHLLFDVIHLLYEVQNIVHNNL